MGRVWQATDRVLGRLVAFKMPKGDPSGPAAARLRREAKVLAQLSHPSIVPLLDSGELASGRPFLVMRLLSGIDLAHAPPADGPAGRLRRVHQLRDVVAGVAHAHSRGIIHRDLKPANVRLEPDGAVQILDWGLARTTTDDTPTDGSSTEDPVVPLTRVGTRLGTPAYMSPEQASGEPATMQSDVWSLGILLWEVLAGRRAYAGDTAPEVLEGVLQGPPPRLSDLDPLAPPPLVAVVERALAPPDDRYGDAGELLDALDAALRLGVPRTGRPRPPAPWPWIAALVLGIGVGGILSQLWTPRPPEPPVSPEHVLHMMLQTDDIHRAEQLAADLLQTDPDNPVARGVFVRRTPQLQLRWTAPTPPCTIGEQLRWDGRALACASERETRFYTIESDGLSLAWTRSEEYHRLVFAGPDHIIGVPPRTEASVRMHTSDGRGFTHHRLPLWQGTPTESRAAHVTVALDRSKVHRHEHDADGTIRSETVRALEAPTPRLLVLADGSELYLSGQQVVRSRPDGTGIAMTWEVPPVEGQPLWFDVSIDDAQLLVVTARGSVAVSPMDGQSWSTWADLDIGSTRHVSVSKDGQHAVATTLGQSIVWSVHSPADRVRLPGPVRTATFLDNQSILIVGADRTRVWRLERPLASGSLRAPATIRSLDWSSSGLAALHTEGARLWSADRQVVDDIPDARAIAHEQGGDRRVVVTADQTLQIYADGTAIARHPTPGCPFVAWPQGQSIVCASATGGPIRVDPQAGTIEHTASLPRHRWYYVAATGRHVSLMDWDTRIYSLVGTRLTAHFTVPWTTRALPTGQGDAVLLNGRDGIYKRPIDGGPQTRIHATSHRVGVQALSPDGSVLALSGLLGGVQLIDANTGTLRLDLSSQVERARGLAFSPDGTQLAVGTDTGLIRILDLSPMTADAEALRATVQAISLDEAQH